MAEPTSNPFRLDGKVALITGGGGGLGSAIALAMARAGAAIVAFERDPQALASLTSSMAAQGATLLGIEGNASEPDEVAGAFQRAEDTLGPVDVLVNTAFVLRLSAPETLTLEDWKFNLDMGLTGYFLCSQEAGRRPTALLPAIELMLIMQPPRPRAIIRRPASCEQRK